MSEITGRLDLWDSGAGLCTAWVHGVQLRHGYDGFASTVLLLGMRRGSVKRQGSLGTVWALRGDKGQSTAYGLHDYGGADWWRYDGYSGDWEMKHKLVKAKLVIMWWWFKLSRRARIWVELQL
jgi:hypothetical protein